VGSGWRMIAVTALTGLCCHVTPRQSHRCHPVWHTDNSTHHASALLQFIDHYCCDVCSKKKCLCLLFLPRPQVIGATRHPHQSYRYRCCPAWHMDNSLHSRALCLQYCFCCVIACAHRFVLPRDTPVSHITVALRGRATRSSRLGHYAVKFADACLKFLPADEC
jgi:hypothetical protein